MAHLLAGDTQAGVIEFRSLARDEFAAIPRDMFWFTAIALLGETCALIGDREQAAVLYRLLSPHSEKLVQCTQAANLGSTHRFLALLSAALGNLDAAEHHFEAALERNNACGLRPVVALMRREYAEMLIARGDTLRAADLLRETLREAEAGRDVAADQPRSVAAGRTGLGRVDHAAVDDGQPHRARRRSPRRACPPDRWRAR